jgi:small subunit ribosomal protein S9
MQQDAKSILATGRRKESRARVRLFLDGKGKVTINGKDLDKYFVTVDQVMQVKKPFAVSSTEGNFACITRMEP